jgi:acetolactate synthase-1/2/3 large subunit
MGMAVPGAVAAKLVHPNRRVVAVTGDGGFLMNSQEFLTEFAHLCVPLVEDLVELRKATRRLVVGE